MKVKVTIKKNSPAANVARQFIQATETFGHELKETGRAVVIERVKQDVPASTISHYRVK